MLRTRGGKEEILYDRPGSAEFSYNPPFTDCPIAQPVELRAGDVITTRCTWKNTTDRRLLFPEEMCAAFGYILGDQPELGCADGVWNN